MAHESDQQWDDDDRFYSSGSHSDDSPILSYRYDRYRGYAPYVRELRVEDRERRSTFTTLAKFFLFCTAMILFCVLMYIPAYNKANYQLPKGVVEGWSIHTNRDTRIYVQPNNVTTIHEPKHICNRSKHKEDLFLLIIVCSSTVNFDRRLAIRQTWGNYQNYLKSSEVLNAVREKYKNYNYTYDLYTEAPKLNVTNTTDRFNRTKRDIAGFGQLLPVLAEALKKNLDKTDAVPEKRFDDDASPFEFDMNKEMQTENYDYDYQSNIMRIPPKGYEDSPDLDNVLSQLKHNFPKIEENIPAGNTDFKLVFLLGLPSQDNETDIQSKIEEESALYGDIIQEGFVDSYNNLTLKSIMMLKWVTKKCQDSVRYILKTDDDMYINVPNLMLNLRNRSKEFDSGKAKGAVGKEYLLIGDLICGARPVLDAHNKWYSPRYMYSGRVYPRYLSGTGYVLSSPAAHALYSAALITNYFHLEDIFITGMCSVRASPRIPPRDDAQFSYRAVRAEPLSTRACAAHGRATAHRIAPPAMRRLQARLLRSDEVDRCERIRLTQVEKRESRLYILYQYFNKFSVSDCT